MKKSLAYGTATALLVTMAATASYTKPAYAVEDGYDPNEILQQATDLYGSEPVYGEGIERVSVLAMALAEGVALTAAGAEVVRQMRQERNRGHDLDSSAGVPNPSIGTAGEYRQMPEAPVPASSNQSYANPMAGNGGGAPTTTGLGMSRSE